MLSGDNEILNSRSRDNDILIFHEVWTLVAAVQNRPPEATKNVRTSKDNVTGLNKNKTAHFYLLLLNM